MAPDTLPFQVDVLFPGFAGKLTTGGLGWGSVALIRGGGNVILLDTGGPVIRGTIKNMLRDHGVAPDDIDTVLLTHLHFDHAYNADMFPRARFVLAAAEWEYATRVGGGDCFTAEYALPLLRHAETRLIRNDGEEILPHITALLTPGHTPGSVSYVLHQGRERWVFSGDAAKNRGELRSGEVQMTGNPEQSKNSIQKILAAGDRILPGHDGWVSIRQGEVIAEGGNDFTLVFGEGVTINGGLTSLTLHMD